MDWILILLGVIALAVAAWALTLLILPSNRRGH
ncbi:hypothetical protein LCGC14_0935400 [marine sediment metagenome]|uniref:Uncharacterized protein n=1 Tax=marine sediment metagenome TaxID=412755 RepID=A0A0F9NR84_9ZZZZ